MAWWISVPVYWHRDEPDGQIELVRKMWCFKDVPSTVILVDNSPMRNPHAIVLVIYESITEFVPVAFADFGARFVEIFASEDRVDYHCDQVALLLPRWGQNNFFCDRIYWIFIICVVAQAKN